MSAYVAFIDPRNSEIDIVQAVGRAIRLSKGKAIGSIVIPVFIEDHDDPDEVLNSSPFKKIWAVVNALRSHDEGLGQQLDQLRQSIGKRGSVGRPDKIIFDSPETITDDFEKALETKLIESTTSSWEFWFGLLKMYKEEFGDCLVTSEPYRNYTLENWVKNQRRRCGQLTLEKINRLKGLGFVWSAREHLWEEGFKYLSAYREEFGDCLVIGDKKINGYGLGIWVGTQRIQKDKLTPEKRSRLSDLGFVWSVRDHDWQVGLKQLKAHKEEFGHLLVKQGVIYLNHNLGRWVANQRVYENNLTSEQKKLLNDLGFVWNVLEYKWEKGYKSLVAYKEEFGDCLVETKRMYLGYSLGSWSVTQRRNKSKMTDEKIMRLDNLGFVWKLKKGPRLQ